MPSAAYHAETDSVSTTQFKLFLESPSEYEATYLTKEMDPKNASVQMKLGTIGHAVLLEKKSIDDVARCYPTTCLKSNGALNSKPAAEFEEKIFPLIAVKDQDIEDLEKIISSVMKSELGDILRMNVKFEQRIDAVINGVKCRCSPDIHSPLHDSVPIWDLKFTERIRPEDWWRTARQMGYHIQSALYSLIAEERYGLPCSFRFWAVETIRPFRVRTYWYEPRSQEITKDFVRRKLEEFRICQETGDWSDKWQNTGEIGPWDLGRNDDNEMVEFEG